MSDPIVVCPKCGNKFTITKALTEQVEKRLRSKLESELKEHDAAREKDYKLKLVREAKKARISVKKELEEDIREEYSNEMIELKKLIKKKEAKLKLASQHEEEVLAKEASIESTVKKEVEKAQRKTREEVVRAVSQEYKKRELGYKKTESDLRKKLDEATQKLEQGSQQKQGEIIEEELEQVLRKAFMCDDILPVPQGKRGADVIQHVLDSSSEIAGTIIWESKDTKTWNNSWINKLKEDQRREKAEAAVIVTSAFPKELDCHFGQISGVWVIESTLVTGLATALRINLLEISRIGKAIKNKPDKMEVLYKYLMSTQFRQRVETIFEAFISMNKDLESEKRVAEHQWAKREKQIQMVAQNMSGMVGDIQGIDPSFPPMKRLELT